MKTYAPQSEPTTRRTRHAAERQPVLPVRTASHSIASSPRVQRLAKDRQLITDSPYVIAQRQRLNHLFGAGLVAQRYSVINPTNYALGVGSKFSTQDAVVAGGAAEFRRTTREQTATGVVASEERGIGAGAWTGPSAPVASTLPPVKYATDGTNAIALESTTAEPKVFYATPGVISASNTKLESVGADARLVDVGGSLDAPKDVNALAGPTLNLHMIKPGKSRRGQPATALEKFGEIAECNSFIKYVLGEVTDRVAVFGAGAGHEALVEEEKEPTRAIATFASGGGDAQALAHHLSVAGISTGTHDTPLPAAYATMATRANRDQALGINAGALATVGEGYVIAQNSPMPGEVTLRAWLDAFDRKVAGAALTPAEQDMFKHKWGYHYAGVVAAVGPDAITLENYNRGTQKHWLLDDLYNQRIASVARLRRYLETLARKGRTIPSVPMLRNQWLASLRDDLVALGAEATKNEIATRDALSAVADAARGLEVEVADLWHFKMYGSQAGQSFHEQWAGQVDDPMTLRIRQSLEITRTRYTNDLQAAIVQLHNEKPVSPAAVQLAAVQAFDLPVLQRAATPMAIGAAFRQAKAGVLKASATAMHGWAVDAARSMDKEPTVVPPVPSNIDSLRAYAAQLDAMIGHWATKGWAVRTEAKQALGARRLQLADLRRKVNAAPTAL